ncbi:MAG: N-acetyltransferase [Roseivivax sp.]|nr:N-acetyltransferase [Roseivivax sp.]
MIIRPARAADGTAIASIWNALIADTTTTFTTVLKTPEGLAQDIAEKQGAFWVAEDDGGAFLGYATYGPFRTGPGYAHSKEHSIHLAPAAWGRGIGRAMMRTLEDHAARAGAHVMVAGVSGENRAGIGFHKAIGYTEVGRMPETGYKFGRWLDLVLLQKRLELPH